jgi:hypothetical protein
VLLTFDIDSTLAGQRLQHHARSWVDADRQASVAYEMSERSPLGASYTQVSISADGAWRSPAGEGQSPSAQPLDELSMIYLVRGLPLILGQPVRLDRHYDPARNPLWVAALGRERLDVGGRQRDVLKVSMTVKDARRFESGSAEMRLWLTDDEQRIPLRIELPVPFGPLVLTLKTPLSHAAEVDR